MALVNALHTKEITTAQVTSVSFGFFSQDEVRACGKLRRATITHAHMHPYPLARAAILESFLHDPGTFWHALTFTSPHPAGSQD